jgi:hypothetical protein
MPTPAQTLFVNYLANGASAVVTNPVGAIVTTLGNDIITAYGLLPSTGIGAPDPITGIASPNLAAVQQALTNLGAAVTAILAHTNRLSGIAAATQPGQPTLNGVVGMAGALDNYMSGYFGSSAALLPTMYTALASASAITPMDVYVNALVAGLTNLTILPAAAVTALNGYTAVLNNYVSNDSNAYMSVVNDVAQASGFLSFAAPTNTTNAAALSLIQAVMSAPTIAILQTVSVIP